MKKVDLFLKLSIIVIYLVSLSGCASPGSDWQRVKQLDTRKGYIEFLQKHWQSELAAEAVKSLERYATTKKTFVISEFKDRLKNQSNTTSRVTILYSDGSGYHVDGLVEWELDPITGKLNNNAWNPGAEHTLTGILNIEDYILASDAKNPLVFKMVRDKGYVYQKGKGLVIAPSREIIRLGK